MAKTRVPGHPLTEFWKRFQLRGVGDDLPEVIPSLQPVIIAADASRVGPYFDLPCGLWAGQTTASAGNFPSAVLAARNRGGILLEWWRVYTGPSAGVGGISCAMIIATLADLVNFGGITNPTGVPQNANPARPLTARQAIYNLAAPAVPNANTGSAVATFSGGDQKAAPQLLETNMPRLWIPQGCGLLVEAERTNCSHNVMGVFYELPDITPP